MNIGRSFWLAPMSFLNAPITFGAFPYFLASQDILGTSCVFSAPEVESLISPWSPCSFSLEDSIYKWRICTLSLLIADEYHYLESLSIHRARKCISTHICVTSVYYVYYSLSVVLTSFRRSRFQLSATRIVLIYSFLIFTSFSHSEKCGSHFPQYMYVFNLCLHMK